MENLDKFVHRNYIERELKFSGIYYYLDKYMNKNIFLTEDLKVNKDVKQNGTIWVFWFQGIDAAPKIVQKCYESVCRNKSCDFAVQLLTEENLNDFIQLPDYIWRKYREGHIGMAHLSDIIRLELLCTYGGCWIDATVFCSRTIPEYMLKGDLFLFKGSAMDEPVLKMSSWWLAADKYNRILHAARRMIYAYWESEEDIRDYFLLHIVMSKIVDEDSASSVIYRNVPYFNNGSAHVLQGKLGIEYDEKEWKIIKDISAIHKLTYKRKYIQGDIYNYYTALINGKLN